MESVRIDKWLWATRVYKTRTLASKACDEGHVTLGDQKVKPARSIRPGDLIKARTDSHQRTVKVLALLEKRVGAALVPEYLEELTTPEEKARRPEEPLFARKRGGGRPTKKERRLLDRFFKT